MVQLSNPYMTTEKTVALTRQTFVGKVMSLLLNMLLKFVIPFLNVLSRFVIAFLPRSKESFNFMAALILKLCVSDG